MGLGSHMAQEDPGREEIEIRDEKKRNSAFLRTLPVHPAACCVSAFLGLSPTVLSARNPGILSPHEYALCLTPSLHIVRCQNYFCCEDEEASTQKVLSWLQTE